MVPPRWRPFVQVVLARIREFYREPEVLFWVYGFPLLLAAVLGIAFAGKEPQRPTVDVQDGTGAESIRETLQADGFDVEVHTKAECDARLVQGRTALFLVPPANAPEFHYDRTQDESVLARYWVEATLLRARPGADAQPPDVPVVEHGKRYIDRLVPGLIGMNLMGGGLFGVGFVLVDMRVRKLFKRLMATPMRRGDFLLAILASRLLFLLPEMFLLLMFGTVVLKVPIYGSFATLLVVILVGAAAFAGLGLLLGCRTEKTEAMSGYINATMLPMYLLSGVFFSSRRFPDEIQPLIQALPLTQLINALREVMLEEAGFAEIYWRLGILAAWAIVCFGLALRFFRWR
jgi:ABC-2 type transport system permease protein